MEKLKIAIFSGTIPSTTFIESLIKGISTEFEVQLFGVKTDNVKYSKDVKLYCTPQNKWSNLVYTLYRCLLLVFKRPKDLAKLIRIVGMYNTVYEKWIWFSKFLPIILYKPDVFHMQWARDIEFYMCLKTEFSIPIIISLRGAHINYTPITKPRIAEIYKQNFPLVDGFHAVSQAIAKEAQQYGADIENTSIIYSPLNNKIFERFNQHKDSLLNDPFKVVSVGRFHWIKGYNYALKAIKLIKDQGVKIEYTIIASGKIPEDIIFLIEKLNLKNSVNIISELDQEELLNTLIGYDVMLLSSLKEGIANVVLEAMAIGLPVVSTNMGGMPEIVKPDATGWLVPIRNPQAMATALIKVRKSEKEYLKTIRLQANKWVKEKFDYDTSFKEFKNMYRKVVIKRINT